MNEVERVEIEGYILFLVYLDFVDLYSIGIQRKGLDAYDFEVQQKRQKGSPKLENPYGFIEKIGNQIKQWIKKYGNGDNILIGTQAEGRLGRKRMLVYKYLLESVGIKFKPFDNHFSDSPAFFVSSSKIFNLKTYASRQSKLPRLLKLSNYYEEYGQWTEDAYAENTKPFSSWFQGQERVYLPLGNLRTESKDEKELSEFFAKFGYSQLDLQKNLVKEDKSGRLISVSKALKKIKNDHKEVDNIEEYVQKSIDLFEKIGMFSRYEKQIDNLMVVISQNPHDIAQASVGRRWDSCFNLETDDGREHIYCELSSGGIIAYLTTTEDREIVDPIARLLIRRFSDKHGNSIAIPEERIYSEVTLNNQVSSVFINTVKKWIFQHQKEQDFSILLRQGASYADSFSEMHLQIPDNKDKLLEIIRNTDIDDEVEFSETIFIVKDLGWDIVSQELKKREISGYEARTAYNAENLTKLFFDKNEAMQYMKYNQEDLDDTLDSILYEIPEDLDDIIEDHLKDYISTYKVDVSYTGERLLLLEANSKDVLHQGAAESSLVDKAIRKIFSEKYELTEEETYFLVRKIIDDRLRDEFREVIRNYPQYIQPEDIEEFTPANKRTMVENQILTTHVNEAGNKEIQKIIKDTFDRLKTAKTAKEKIEQLTSLSYDEGQIKTHLFYLSEIYDTTLEMILKYIKTIVSVTQEYKKEHGVLPRHYIFQEYQSENDAGPVNLLKEVFSRNYSSKLYINKFNNSNPRYTKASMFYVYNEIRRSLNMLEHTVGSSSVMEKTILHTILNSFDTIKYICSQIGKNVVKFEKLINESHKRFRIAIAFYEKGLDVAKEQKYLFDDYNLIINLLNKTLIHIERIQKMIQKVKNN